MPKYRLHFTVVSRMQIEIEAASFSQAKDKLPGMLTLNVRNGSTNGGASHLGFEFPTATVEEARSCEFVPSVWRPIDKSEETMRDIARLDPENKQ